MGTLLELRKRGAAKTHQIWARVSIENIMSDVLLFESCMSCGKAMYRWRCHH